jgi:hypothetical protein
MNLREKRNGKQPSRHSSINLRIQYLDAYQRFLLEEPDSAVRQPLKDLFLMLRLTVETAYASDETASEGPHTS